MMILYICLGVSLLYLCSVHHNQCANTTYCATLINCDKGLDTGVNPAGV